MTFHFAWVAPGETSFTTEFEREDEEVLSFEITHDEGDFASLHLEIRNPRVGLLSVGRKRWAWLSFDDGTGSVPLFFGRLIGLPEEMSDEVVALSFIAKPLDYQTTKAALAMTMRQPEYYDPMFIQKERREEPDTVLEARPMVWCIDRVSHAVTASHVIAGEDGTIDFGGNVFADSVKCGYTGAPQRKVIVQAEVRWGQYGLGSFTVHYDRIKTYTGDGLLSDWPKAGQRIGAGWSVKSAFAKDLYSRMNSTNIEGSDRKTYWYYEWAIRGDVEVQYEAQRDYVETAIFTMQSDVQEIVTEAGDEEIITLQISGDADEAVDAGDMPIGDLRRRAYFPTDRGALSIKYIANVSAARLLASARCAEVSFEVPFSYAPELSLRKSGTIADSRLPGGTATGKIKAYTISADGGSGALVCSVTLGCTPGNGGAVSVSEGTPSYASDFADGYQTYDGASSAAVIDAAGDPTFVIGAYDAIPVQDDGLDLFNMTKETCVIENRVDYRASDQKGHLYTTIDDATAWLKDHPTHVTLQLRPVTGGPFTTPYEITSSTLVVPKTIDLEAASS